MGMQNKKPFTFRILAITLAAVVVLAATSRCLRNAEAQGPALSNSKSAKSVPAPLETGKAGKPAAYIVAKGQVIKELVLTGELKAERSTSIMAPNIRSSFSNTVTYLAPEGTIVKKGDRIVEFDDSSLLSSK